MVAAQYSILVSFYCILNKQTILIHNDNIRSSKQVKSVSMNTPDDDDWVVVVEGRRFISIQVHLHPRQRKRERERDSRHHCGPSLNGGRRRVRGRILRSSGYIFGWGRRSGPMPLYLNGPHRPIHLFFFLTRQQQFRPVTAPLLFIIAPLFLSLSVVLVVRPVSVYLNSGWITLYALMYTKKREEEEWERRLRPPTLPISTRTPPPPPPQPPSGYAHETKQKINKIKIKREKGRNRRSLNILNKYIDDDNWWFRFVVAVVVVYWGLLRRSFP